ncbi:acyl carrier protein [Dictyobacter aurantiacus]|uniref:Acyl carrier protein n=1 Tax=Dictyobacter aurantiacus TaxID=1936993 RepID=A0A401ZBN8_9CHLR|nr:acyl carrier protein [Dictyobacter aurantiacus]GCE04246.1 hypothetical protein KDAU_15750 [Dictyobacter aurantiacus]
MPQKKQQTQAKTVMAQILLFQPTIEASDEKVQNFLDSVQKLPKGIRHLLSASAGENQSLKHKGFTHGVILLFEDATSLHEAMQQPAYLKLSHTLQGISDHTIMFEQSVVIDVPVIEIPSPQQKQATNQKSKNAAPGQRKRNATIAPPSPELSEWQQLARAIRQKRVTHIDQRLVRIVCDQLSVDEQEVIPSASLVEDLNADSLDLVELFMTFEEVFKLEIPDDHLELLMEIGAIQAYLELQGVLGEENKM